ncbi:MAG: hypothetical protein EBR87_10870, partial [Cytophagia bacterium]|nr:hypothetical protein [Cytophagia bacterium]
IQLGTDCENALIYFCLDDGTWQDYSKPFIIDKRTKIYSYASLPSGEKSDTSFAEFFKAPNLISKLKSMIRIPLPNCMSVLKMKSFIQNYP